MITKNANLNEIGNSMNSTHLEYGDIEKYTKKDSKGTSLLILSKIKFYYERENALIAIQYILQSVENRERKDPSTFIYPDQSYFGPQVTTVVNSKKKTNPIDEIILSLGENESIYLIQGYYYAKTKEIIKMNLYTTKGQFVEFGASEKQNNFKWEYHYNLREFNGFIIGWNDCHINYLAGIEKETEALQEANEINKVLKDVTYDLANLVNPCYQSTIYGTDTNETIFEDYFEKSDLLNDLRNEKVFLSQITIGYSNTINMIELEYAEVLDQLKKKRIIYKGRKYDSSNKKVALSLSFDDFISQFTINYDTYIEGIILQSLKGKKLSCASQSSFDHSAV